MNEWRPTRPDPLVDQKLAQLERTSGPLTGQAAGELTALGFSTLNAEQAARLDRLRGRATGAHLQAPRERFELPADNDAALAALEAVKDTPSPLALGALRAVRTMRVLTPTQRSRADSLAVLWLGTARGES